MRPEVPSDPGGVELALSAGPARITDEGEGPTFLLVHGMPGSSRDFRWLGAALAPSARVVRVDLPGSGRTPVGRWGRDVDARGAFVAEVADALSLEDAVVLGHSMGGAVATAAARASERLTALALLASVGATPHLGFRAFLAVRPVGYGLGLPGAGRAAGPLVRRAFLQAGFKGFADDELVRTMQVLARFRFGVHASNLASVGKPTLVAWCADDRVVEPAIAERLYWTAPAGPRICFPTGGHALQASRASELAESLLAWRRQ